MSVKERHFSDNLIHVTYATKDTGKDVPFSNDLAEYFSGIFPKDQNSYFLGCDQGKVWKTFFLS